MWHAHQYVGCGFETKDLFVKLVSRAMCSLLQDRIKRKNCAAGQITFSVLPTKQFDGVDLLIASVPLMAYIVYLINRPSKHITSDSLLNSVTISSVSPRQVTYMNTYISGAVSSAKRG